MNLKRLSKINDSKVDSKLSYELELKKLWDKGTIRAYTPEWEKAVKEEMGDEYYQESLASKTNGYRGIAFDVTNQWTEKVKGGVRFVFGAPYRKEVCTEDSLGTYQKGSFIVKSSTLVLLEGWADSEDMGDVVQGTVDVNGEIQVPLGDLIGENLWTKLTPSEFDSTFYHDIGSMY